MVGRYPTSYQSGHLPPVDAALLAAPPQAAIRRAVRILAKNTHNVESTPNSWERTQKVMLECRRHRFGQSDSCRKRVCVVGSIRDLLISG